MTEHRSGAHRESMMLERFARAVGITVTGLLVRLSPPAWRAREPALK
jgi:hypothetical protein